MDAADLKAEREALIAEIHAAFKDVSRMGGVSWSETYVLDFYGTPEERAEARDGDRDWSWTDLVDDPDWQIGQGSGGLTFLDAIGFRYYLPAALMRTLREGSDEGIRFHLTLPSAREIETLREQSAPRNLDCERMDAYTIEQWSLIDDRQRRCVARFLRYMIAMNRGKDHRWQDELRRWNAAYESYWKSFE